MANHPATHEQPKADPHKAGPAPAPAPHDDAPPPPQQMEVGGTATAKVSFTDVNGADVTLGSVTWTSTGPVTLVPDDKDPTSAALTATASGRAHVKADVTSDSGAPAEAAVDIMVIQTGTPSVGKIDLTVAPPSKKAR